MPQFVDAASFVGHLFNYRELNGYLFRGITNAEHRYTEPRAFREKFIKEIAKKIPHNESVIREWFSKTIKAVRENNNKALAATPQIL